MKTYFRILSYARPLEKYILPFFLTSLLGSAFGVLNFTLLQPLLDVLFDKVGIQELNKLTQKPVANSWLDVQYIINLFNYYFGQVLETSGKKAALQFVCGTIVASVLISNIFKYISVRILEKVKAHTIYQLRQNVFEKTLNLHLGFFSNERKGDLIARITTDVQEVEASVGRAFIAAFREPFTLILYFVILFKMSLSLTLFTLLILPISGGIIGGLAKKLKEDAKEVQQQLSNVVSLLDETFGGMRVIKGFNADAFIKNRFKKENGLYRTFLLRLVNRQEIASPFSEFMGVTAVAGILLYGGSMVIDKNFELSASTFITYILIFSQVLRPAKEISGAFSSIQRGIAAGERILALIDTPPAIQNASNALKISSFDENIVFKNVDFEYEKGISVLQNLCFSMAKGQTVALVGSSGGGKSTIADLIPRFYDPTKGQILIDGHNLRQIEMESLRNLMGIVTQESILFNDTIFNNIAFGIEATQAQVEQAAQIAHAHGFIMESPEGYQTIIGDRGTKLSGGQRQRLSIARAILKNPPILLLDEATSALDTESEKLVQEALAYLMQNRTSLVIAHRLSTIQNADLILVIHQGQIIEQGTHTQLLENEDGFYKKLSTLQMG